MNSELSIIEIQMYKTDLNKFIERLNLFSEENNFNIQENDKSLFIFISKRIYFFKILNNDMNNHHIEVLISDYLHFIISIIRQENRYLYLNERSIIENHMRFIFNDTVENNHITNDLFGKLKIKYGNYFNENKYSLLKSEYAEACNYIHGGKILKESLCLFFNDYISVKNSINRNNHYERLIKIIKCFDMCVLSTNVELIDVSFHRRKSLLKYLMGDNYHKQLFKLKS